MSPSGEWNGIIMLLSDVEINLKQNILAPNIFRIFVLCTK